MAQTRSARASESKRKKLDSVTYVTDRGEEDSFEILTNQNTRSNRDM